MKYKYLIKLPNDEIKIWMTFANIKYFRLSIKLFGLCFTFQLS
jgi:hypothetical protein